MRVTVDLDTCLGNAQCVAAAPEVFMIDDDGELTILDSNPPAALWAKVERAAGLCPTQAISVEAEPLRST